MLELAFVFFEEGEAVGAWRQRFNPPGVNWDHPDVRSALDVNHIDPASLQGEPRFGEMIEMMNSWLSKYDLWVGHNVSFDLRMLNQELAREGKSKLQPRAALCTKKLHKYLHPEEGHHLSDTCRRFQVELRDAHTAQADAEACGYAFVAMLKTGRLPKTMAELMSRFRA